MAYGGKAREKCDSQVNELALANLRITGDESPVPQIAPYVPFTRIQLGVLGSEAILGHR
jgi:hypothetical protein